MSEKLLFKVRPDLNGERLDIALTKLIPDFSRRKIRSIVDMGGCYVNKKRVRISSRSVHTNDTIELVHQHKNQAEVSLKKTDILYEDDEIIAINKPPGLASQATRTDAKNHVVPLLKPLVEAKKKLFLIHRLDQETSGVLLIAKGQEASDKWGKLFKERKINKIYEALCLGKMTKGKIIIKNFLSRIHPNTGVVKASSKKTEHTREAHTEVELLKYFPKKNISHVQCKLFTGRSHQLRVHLASVDLPILGDKKYNTKPEPMTIGHQLLHAKLVEFVHPTTGKKLKITASQPKLWLEIIRDL